MILILAMLVGAFLVLIGVVVGAAAVIGSQDRNTTSEIEI